MSSPLDIELIGESNTGIWDDGTDGPTILQVLPALEAGGVERGTVQIAGGIVKAGGRALVASAGGTMEHEVERAGGKHVTLPLASKNPARIWANAGRLAELIAAEGVDLVHARSRAPAWSAWLAARRTGKPFVTTFHSPYGHNWVKHSYNAIMARGDAVIAISEYLAEHVTRTYKVGDNRLVTIPRGIDLDIFNPAAVSASRMIQLARAWRLPEDRPVVMLPGRLTRWKGQGLLLDAIAALGRRDIACVLVGADQGREAYREELEEKIASAGLGEIVRLVGHCRDMAAAYMLADVVVSASTDPEGFGRVAVEAQAMGRPVIASDHGGSRETVHHGATGWLVKPGDLQALTSALHGALALSPEARSAMAERARRNVQENYSVQQMCARTLAVYDGLIKR